MKDLCHPRSQLPSPKVGQASSLSRGATSIRSVNNQLEEPNAFLYTVRALTTRRRIPDSMKTGWKLVLPFSRHDEPVCYLSQPTRSNSKISCMPVINVNA